MKILIYTAMNQRHKVSRLWALGIKRFIAAAPDGVECQVLAVITEDESVAICREFGFEFLRHPNLPLGKKFNAGLNHAMQTMHWDYLLLLGDDDLISSEAWAHLLPVMQQGYPYCGFNSIYFYSPGQQKARKFSYADQGCPDKLIGCGRIFRRDILDHVCWNLQVNFRAPYRTGGCEYPANVKITMPVYKATYLYQLKAAEIVSEKPFFAFWKDEQNKGLDNESEVRLLMNGFQPYVIATDKPMMTDVKTGMNLWGFDHFLSLGTAAEPDDATNFMGEDEQDYILQNLLTDPAEIHLKTERITLPSVMMVSDTKDAFIQRRIGELLEREFKLRFNRDLKDRSQVTVTTFPDHPNYIEYWLNWKSDNRKFVCGMHITQEGNEMCFSIVDREEMSKAKGMLNPVL